MRFINNDIKGINYADMRYDLENALYYPKQLNILNKNN